MHAEQTRLPHLASDVAGGQRAGLEPLGHVRRKAFLGEPARGVPDRTLLVVEQVIHIEQVVLGVHNVSLEEPRLSKV
ncbi:hypothetical protein GCM10012276_09640 [Nocardioides deserti]|nr:hypothetical protein GCM10012276_09640 [Nocardioides deserti]